jgi:hypothetical protein
MHVTTEALKMQERRIHRARRIARRGDQARNIGVQHKRAQALLPLDLAEPGSLDRYFADSGHRQFKADRAFEIARRYYQLAERVRLGIA